MLQFLNNVIIIQCKVLLPQILVTVGFGLLLAVFVLLVFMCVLNAKQEKYE
jgi:hypothetical protein